MILGLDISTSCTGWCVIDQSGSLIDMGYIFLSSEKTFFDKAEKVKKTFLSIRSQHDIQKIFIEENLQAFRPGFSSAKTLLTLARFNGIVSYLSQLEFCLAPQFINVNTARRELGIKIISKKNGGDPTKEQILSWVAEEIKNTSYKWPTKILKSGPRKGQKVLELFCYDMADAYVIALSGHRMNT